MNPILRLLNWRIDCLFKKLNINPMPNTALLSNKLFSCGYIDHNIYDPKYCFWIIKNIIWHNITKYKIKQTKNIHSQIFQIHMLYNNYRNETEITYDPHRYLYQVNLNYQSLISNGISTRTLDLKSSENINNLLKLISNYFILSDIIIIKYAVPDLCSIIKQLLYHIMLLKN